MSQNCIQWYNENCSPIGSYNTTIQIINELKNIKQKQIIIVEEQIQTKFKRIYPNSLDDIKLILDIHNNNHTSIDWNNNCNFNRISQMNISQIKNSKYIINGEFTDVNIQNTNITTIQDDGIIFNFIQQWGYGYFHFICEILPRILFYIKHKDNFKNKSIIFILYTNDTFILRLLQLLPDLNNVILISYHENNIFDIQNRDVYSITQTISGNPSLENIQLIREYYLKKIAPFDEYCIIIKRNETDRFIENFDEVFEYIKTIFPNEKWIIFENQTIDETLHIFNNAKLVIGAHGAGLANLVFSNENIYVLEFVPSLNFNCCYWHLSNLLKQNYMMMPIDNYDGNYSFNINMEQFKKYITYIYKQINF